jgi:hypothetical protein
MKSVGVWVLGAWFGALTLACSSSSSSSDKPPVAAACNTLTTPRMFTVSDVSPLPGSSVTNMAITEKFTIAEPLLLPSLTVQPTSAHSAGNSGLATSWTPAQDAGGGVSYTSAPVTWDMAGKVELDFAGVYQDPSNGCYYAFPKPMFSYTVTAP